MLLYVSPNYDNEYYGSPAVAYVYDKEKKWQVSDTQQGLDHFYLFFSMLLL